MWPRGRLTTGERMRRQQNAKVRAQSLRRCNIFNRRVHNSPALLTGMHMTRPGSFAAQRTSLRSKVGGGVNRRTRTYANFGSATLQEFGPTLPAHSEQLGTAQQSREETPSHAAESTSHLWPWDAPRASDKASSFRSVEAPTELIFSLYKRGEGWFEEIMPHLSMEKRPIEGRKQNIDKVRCHLERWFIRTFFQILHLAGLCAHSTSMIRSLD
jgi:hypothetical protein